MSITKRKSQLNLHEKEQIEIKYWETSEFESPQSDSLENLLYKIGDASIFFEKLSQYKDFFESADRIIEIGAGQCYASCIVKRVLREKAVFATDIATAALEVAPRWEHIFGAALDGAWVCRSYEVPTADESFDLAFCFQSAHHFVRHRRTFIEMHRILRPGGTLIYLHEPGTPAWAHSFARNHMNRNRPSDVPEDALIYSQLASLATEAGFEASINFAPTITHKQPLETIYHGILSKSKLLQRLLPCIVDLTFTKLAPSKKDL
jgi:SAM-dependent methyltransferase